MTQKIFGHQNPDTDTITSALVVADIETQLGNDATPYRLGEISSETAYALEHFGVEAPALLNEVGAGDEVILVDHNEKQQSAPGIENATVTKVFDHHRIANFETEGPLYYRAEPVGCTATILNKVYKENNLTISKVSAGLMLSAIISDTLLFKSPTTTEEDIDAASELKDIAGIDLEEYGLEMLKAGASTSNKTALQLITGDAKTFDIGEKSVRIAQINVVDVDEVFSRREEIEIAINTEIENDGYDLFTLIVTDILNSNSKVLALGPEFSSVERAFDVALDQNTAILEGVVSRKKQVVPNITKALADL